MGFPTSIVGRHQFLNALSGLGIVLEKPNFPVTSACPVCKENTLYILDDIITSGMWLFCTTCKTHGDIITFGAQIWNTSLPDTLEKFSDLNVISPAEGQRAAPEYSRFSAKYQTAEAFWQTVETQLWNHGDDIISCRLRELGLRYENNECYGLVGVAHYDQITELCRHLGRPKPLKSRENGSAIVYPFYDLPYRLTGFLVAQYNDAYEIRQNFLPISGYKQKRPEAGYFLLEKILLPHNEQYRGNQFVSEDLHWVLKTQTKATARGGKFLPLVGSYSGPEAESYGLSWAALQSAPRIFHSASISPGLISRACNAKGYVSVVIPQQVTEAANLVTIRAKTKTWQDSLKNTLLSLNEINALSFAGRMSVPHDKLSLALQNLPHSFSAGFVDRVLSEAVMAPAVPQKKWLVIERSDGWWTHLGKQICNISPRITKLIQTDRGEKIYVGTITTADGETYTFTDIASKIENLGLFDYSSAVLTAHKKLVIYDKRWNGRSLAFALQLHPPEIIYVPTSYGWDEQNKVFRFDTYEITNTGDVKTIPTWPKKTAKITFDEPMPVAPLTLHDLITPAYENSYVWHVVAAVVGNLVAPILNLEPAAVAVTKENFKAVSEITKALCCPVARATAASKYAARGFFTRFTKELPWPTLVFNTFSDELISNIVPRHFNQPVITRLSKHAAAVAPGYGWRTINSTPVRQNSDFQVLRHVLPAFIQYALKNHMQMFNCREDAHQQTLTALHNWLVETYNTSFNLKHAETSFFAAHSAHVALFQELNRAFVSGKIAVLPQPRNSQQPKNYVLKRKDQWWINQHAVDRYFYAARSVAPNWSVIVDLLQQNDVYIGEQTVHNMNGIILRNDWCEQFWSDTNINTETG